MVYLAYLAQVTFFRLNIGQVTCLDQSFVQLLFGFMKFWIMFWVPGMGQIKQNGKKPNL